MHNRRVVDAREVLLSADSGEEIFKAVDAKEVLLSADSGEETFKAVDAREVLLSADSGWILGILKRWLQYRENLLMVNYEPSLEFYLF